ncbi:hypothetical protein THIX_30687 [Thiomonas sp. X19]|nr:hypothetical protein THIX_30687 [Thiomonas sp. X19]
MQSQSPKATGRFSQQLDRVRRSY